MSDENKIVLIDEVYGPVCQGEGGLIGQPTIFVRTGGCDSACIWCDTPYAAQARYSHEWKRQSPEVVALTVHELAHRKPILVTLSGGNPAMQKNLKYTISRLHEYGHTVTIETQGTIYPDWADRLDYLTLSPKPPSSHMKFNALQFEKWYLLSHSIPTALKIVVFDDVDYEWAKCFHDTYPDLKLYLQVGNPEFQEAVDIRTHFMLLRSRYLWLSQKVMDDGLFSATVLPQLHVMMFSNARKV